ncbi:lactate racemase domain-containing protein [Peloplasma aerotolerans]|uniref:Lactate racemase domain-containing protein n=1 Tax=Peloplasma aerotolerans TaxID=3044389 RepID=A0AAW6U4X7_9MOLU|nr:lactate racemase domain-containing protein [Mariniplasma sp. M4Ah]MDI6453021.1 lactate racemase domain-containing protein [Mariniplasma sp. M4Ah]
MTEIFIKETSNNGLSDQQIKDAVKKSIAGKSLKKVLLVPPDFTRFYSNAGLITNTYYHLLKDYAQVDILPALGTHEAMTKEECEEMYGDIPFEKFIYHNWREDVINIGEVPKEYLLEVSEGLWDQPIQVEINKLIMDESYDLVISIGQIVPHEVVGIANHSKNLFVGCGGKNIISQSHMLGAVYGMERMMGKDHTPVRKVLDYSLKHFLNKRPVLFALTVTTAPEGKTKTHGLFISESRKGFELAIELVQEKNLNFLDKGIKKCVVYLEPKEFRSTWLGNKAVYRTRMAIEDGGELIVLAPGITKFGEDLHNDHLIRKYGYQGRLKVLELFKTNEELQQNMSIAAHLIHGSSDGRFSVTYAVKKISKEEIESVHFQAADYDVMIKKYPPDQLKAGWNTLPDGEEIFYVPNPALGLWIDKNRF